MAKLKKRLSKRRQQIRSIFHDCKPIHKRITLWIIIIILLIDIILRFGVLK